MTGNELTPEQKVFANLDSEAFVEACPGAGKTHTVVARLSKIAAKLPPRRGVAVLSFTNSAVEEFAKRCRDAGVEQLVHYPSFFGTFDAFVGRFLVLPFGVSNATSRPLILDSWKRFDVEIRLSKTNAFSGPGVSLDSFDPETNTIDPTRIGYPALRKHVTDNQNAYQQAAKGKRASLHRAGYLSAGDARLEASRHINEPNWNLSLGRALASRFHEIIVDEAQDCNPLDFEILSWLRGHGVRVTLVCDPDQSIYGFRHGTPGDLRAFGEKYPTEKQLKLTGNFRSSNPICALAATLRVRSVADTQCGDAANSAHPLIIASYSEKAPPPTLGRLFIERIEANGVGLARADCIVLAHKLSNAQRAAGDPMSQETFGSSRIETLARAIGEFWAASATSKSRDAVLRRVERLLLDLMGLWQDDDHHPSPVIERAGLNKRIFRRQALEIVMRTPKTCADTDEDRKKWIAITREEIERLKLVLPSGNTIAGYFRCPPKGEWSKHLQASVNSCLASSTIHDAKGKEYEGVCVVIPPDRAPDNRTSHLLDAWENKAEFEAKRVLYVGITRAKKLAMLAVPEAFADRCIAILVNCHIPHERIKIAKTPRIAK